MSTYQPPPGAPRGFVPGISSAPMTSNAPAGTFLPGTKVQVGNQRVVIDRYLSEGGFAHVYVVTMPKPVDGRDKAVLKRVAVPDKEHLANMRTEVETMKRLRGHKQIVKYIDSHASSLKTGGYEVFLLMEWCDGGGLIDFMNTRLQNRLTEPEILKIFTDIAEGVACMHYLKPPLLHRDLKVENVLITIEGKSRTYKLCDFGSAAPPRPAATTAAEGRLIEDDVQRHTTLQYRSPEMIDVYRKHPIDEKSDIWALGCFLYKLCYYTTPFEDVGQMAILNASFKYPGYPRFSDDLKLLIASMLREQPSKRPNIYQVLAKASKLDGRPLSIRDIYSGRSQSEDARNKVLPQPASSSQSRAGATLAAPKQEAAPSIPQIEPMRRGRPMKTVSAHTSAKPSPSPLRMLDSTDPFAQLDGHKKGSDELSSRFPKLEEFSLLSDRNSNFAFESQQSKQTEAPKEDLSKRVTEALADDAFARPASPLKAKPPLAPKPEVAKTTSVLEKKKSMERKEAEAAIDPIASHPRRAQMVSTGTMTSPSPPPIAVKPVSNRTIWRVPVKDSLDRSATVSHPTSQSKSTVSAEPQGSRLANLLRDDAVNSQIAYEMTPQSPTSSRPSLEGGRPLLRDLDSGVKRSRSLNLRNRPASVNIGTHPTHVKDQDIRTTVYDLKPSNTEPEMAPLTAVASDSNIKSDVDFLRAREEEEKEKHKHMKRLSGGNKHQKRSSLPSISLSGTKNILQGRFGDAFKKFESHGDSSHSRERSSSPAGDEQRILTPIAGSETTDLSDDRRALEETEELSPELRRELEKQHLEAEERRVARAAAEYRQRVGARAGGPPPPSTKAASIQNRVQSLLSESDRPAQKTATGYGRFTGESPTSPDNPAAQMAGMPAPPSKTMSAPASQVNLNTTGRMQRPAAPPKPKGLQTGKNEPAIPGARNDGDGVNGADAISPDDWEEKFSKRYPSLSHLEMVETDIEQKPDKIRLKEI